MLLFTMRVEILGRTLWDFNAHFAGGLPEFMLYDGRLALHWQMIIYLTTGFITAIAVSFFTRPEAKEKLDRFYTCLRTPVRPGEPEVEPFTLPEGVEPAPRRVLIDHPDFEIPRPGLISVIGFLAGWAGVGLLIWIFFMIMHG
jgi:hypothetical protein